jgi:hypothetical protein
MQGNGREGKGMHARAGNGWECMQCKEMQEIEMDVNGWQGHHCSIASIGD